MPVSSEGSTQQVLLFYFYHVPCTNWSVQVCTYRPSVSATWLGKGCPVCWQQRFLPLLQLVERFCLDRRPPAWLPFWPSGWHLKGSAFVSSLLPISERHFFLLYVPSLPQQERSPVCLGSLLPWAEGSLTQPSFQKLPPFWFHFWTIMFLVLTVLSLVLTQNSLPEVGHSHRN